ncbi:hypothetical protein AMAG_02914 [Allomyces macrogynus ATCC 38327]|uniref:MADS-box domain-containing protein n=1 Tax=Allomyces macrogynus (strain ATCC 38327) TaxID=578462 RepID=A0A0L0S3N4_ALLM3|nr:hypothetical protein AMAG_02914 [Allomyces macrogynus ATCC 38327]|eukprot:KNE57167.1 hypothetical protein AMAG_02914 [Allomyces macrogynus ATCC 38327]
MGRRKIKIELIPGERTRQATFIKRRMGIMKKAYELAELCGCQIGMLIFSSSGKLFEFSSTGDLDSILLRYAEYTQPHEIRTSRHYKEPGFQDTHVGATTAHADADSDDDDDMEQDVPLSATDPVPPRPLPTPAAAPPAQPAQNGAPVQHQQQQQPQQQSQQPVGIAPVAALAPCPVPGHGPDALHRVPDHGAQYANSAAPPAHRHAPTGHSGYYQDSRPAAAPQHVHSHAQHPAPLLHPSSGPFAPAPPPPPPSHAHGLPVHVHGPPHAAEEPQHYRHPHYYPLPPPPVETAPVYSHPPPPGYYHQTHAHVAPYPAHGPPAGAPHHAPYAPPPPPHSRPYDAYHDAPRSAPPGPAPRPQSWPYAPTDVPSRFIDPHPHVTPGSPLSTMAAQMDPSRTVHSPVLKRSASDMLGATETAARWTQRCARDQRAAIGKQAQTAAVRVQAAVLAAAANPDPDVRGAHISARRRGPGECREHLLAAPYWCVDDPGAPAARPRPDRRRVADRDPGVAARPASAAAAAAPAPAPGRRVIVGGSARLAADAARAAPAREFADVAAPWVVANASVAGVGRRARGSALAAACEYGAVPVTGEVAARAPCAAAVGALAARTGRAVCKIAWVTAVGARGDEATVGAGGGDRGAGRFGAFMICGEAGYESLCVYVCMCV